MTMQMSGEFAGTVDCDNKFMVRLDDRNYWVRAGFDLDDAPRRRGARAAMTSRLDLLETQVSEGGPWHAEAFLIRHLLANQTVLFWPGLRLFRQQSWRRTDSSLRLLRPYMAGWLTLTPFFEKYFR